MFDNRTITTSELPAIFVNGIVPLPHNEIRIDLSSTANLSALKDAEQYRNHIVIIVQKGDTKDITDRNNIAVFGVVAKISMNLGVGTKVRRLKIETIVRCKINDFIQTKKHFIQVLLKFCLFLKLYLQC